MAKSKKELLAGRQKVGRPSLRRAVVTNEAQEAAVVRKVSDNPPPPPTSPAPAAAPTAKPSRSPKKKATTKATASKPAATKKKKAATQPATEDKEPFMRMSFDVPKSLHLKLKMHTLKNGVTIKAHMLRIIEESIDD